MSSLMRGIHAGAGVGLVLLVVGCSDPASPREVDTKARAPQTPEISGTYVLDLAQSEEYDLSHPCGAPVSGRLVLEGGTWRSEVRWAPGCIESAAADEFATFTRGGRLEVRGATVTLIPTGPGADPSEAESGAIGSGTVTVYGHCGGADVYVRQLPPAPPART